ncbi:MAG: hypothetical protein HUJ76_07475, partial [Parasporobacterium sp.]|nr:hypothetical protein [Parasporobacterium sp.]
IKIGMPCYDTTDEQFLAIQEYFNYIQENFNIQITYSESLQSPEDEFAFIQSCAAAGCKGIFGYYNIAEAESIKLASSLGMYYATPMNSWTESCHEDPFYVGGYQLVGDTGDTDKNGDYLAGYALGKSMGSQGFNHIAFCDGGASFGVPMFIDRKQGFLDGLKDAGYDKFTDADLVSGWPGTDDFAAKQTEVISGDYDAVVSSFNCLMWIQPIMESGKEIALAAIGEANETYKDFMDMGIIRCIVYDCEETVFGMYLPILVNAITGYTELTRTAEGTPLACPVTRWTIETPEQIDAIYEYHDAGNWFAPAEAVASTFKGINPDATLETYDAVFNVTLEEALAM